MCAAGGAGGSLRRLGVVADPSGLLPPLYEGQVLSAQMIGRSGVHVVCPGWIYSEAVIGEIQLQVQNLTIGGKVRLVGVGEFGLKPAYNLFKYGESQECQEVF